MYLSDYAEITVSHTHAQDILLCMCMTWHNLMAKPVVLFTFVLLKHSSDVIFIIYEYQYNHLLPVLKCNCVISSRHMWVPSYTWAFLYHSNQSVTTVLIPVWKFRTRQWWCQFYFGCWGNFGVSVFPQDNSKWKGGGLNHHPCDWWTNHSTVWSTAALTKRLLCWYSWAASDNRVLIKSTSAIKLLMHN